MTHRILVLSDKSYRTYGGYAQSILNKAGYITRVQNPSTYSELGSQLPDLVVQEARVTVERRADKKDLALTRRVVKDILRSGKSISMLVVSAITGHRETRDFMRVLQRLGDGRFDYQRKAFNEDELLRQVRELLGITT